MKLGTSNIYIKVNAANELFFAQGEERYKKVIDDEKKVILRSIYNVFNRRVIPMADKMAYLDSQIKKLSIIPESTATSATTIDAVALESTLQKLIDFFSEFSFEPNYRFVNTFAYACQSSIDTAKNYVARYFELTDSQFMTSIVEKMKSTEFKEICNAFSTTAPTHKVNSRFKLYYGSAGTGKTTSAMLEAENNCMTCHSAMLPSDLMEDFKFVDGKAEFVPSALQIAMTEGKKIVLDEINLLPFESLRFLQTILDGKTEFIYKGKTVKIVDGFKIIGTMNLVVNGCTYGLPEPLVDRAEDLRKYSLTAKNLVGAII